MMNCSRDRNRFPTRGFWFFTVMIITFAVTTAKSAPQADEAESRLRQRIEGYWNALQKSDYTAAEQFVHPESIEVFRRKAVGSAVLKWQIEKLSFNPDYTICETVMRVTRVVSLQTGLPIEWTLFNNWVLHEGDWYFYVPREGLSLFEAVNKARLARENVRPAPAEPAPVQVAASNFELVPATADFGSLRAGVIARRSVRVVNRSGRTVKIDPKSELPSRVRFSVDKTKLGPGDVMVISLSYRPAAAGEFLDNLKLRTDLPDGSCITIPIRGTVER